MTDNSWSWTIDTAFPSTRGAHIDCMQQILQQLTELGWDGSHLFGIEMALEESLTNAIRHGNKLDASKQVRVACKLSAEMFWLAVEDEGEGFCPDHVPDCRHEENLAACGGRGLLLIQAYMSEVQYNDRGNRVTMHLDKTRGSQATDPS